MSRIQERHQVCNDVLAQPDFVELIVSIELVTQAPDSFCSDASIADELQLPNDRCADVQLENIFTAAQHKASRKDPDSILDRGFGQTELAIGRVEDAQWPSLFPHDGEEHQESGTDWLLVRLMRTVTCNHFFVPGCKVAQTVSGFYDTQSLTSGKVWVCGGASGLQEGYMAGASASIVFAGETFLVRSIALQHSLRNISPSMPSFGIC